ncbi:MAG: hypothetical protein QW273_03760 [Candidatus Pacearchaeota archaeon]
MKSKKNLENLFREMDEQLDHLKVFKESKECINLYYKILLRFEENLDILKTIKYDDYITYREIYKKLKE